MGAPMNANRIRAVAFDAVGTLFHHRGAVGDVYRRVALKHGRDVPAVELQAAFERETGTHGTPVDAAGWKSLVATLFREHGPFPGFDAYFEDVYAVFRTGRCWACYAETRDVLRSLRGRDVALAVVSNFDRGLGGVLDDLGIGEYFAAVVTPDTAGCAKPDPRIFIDAAARLGAPPAATLLVGDDFELDVRAARAAGLEGVWVDREPGGPAPGAIADLSGVLAMLDRE